MTTNQTCLRQYTLCTLKGFEFQNTGFKHGIFLEFAFLGWLRHFASFERSEVPSAQMETPYKNLSYSGGVDFGCPDEVKIRAYLPQFFL